MSRSQHTMTRPLGFVKMSIMRTVLIVATIAMGAAQLMWRVMRTNQPALAPAWEDE